MHSSIIWALLDLLWAVCLSCHLEDFFVTSVATAFITSVDVNLEFARIVFIGQMLRLWSPESFPSVLLKTVRVML